MKKSEEALMNEEDRAKLLETIEEDFAELRSILTLSREEKFIRICRAEEPVSDN